MNVPQRKNARVSINEIPQVPRVHLQSFQRRAVKTFEGLEFDFGQHHGEKWTIISSKVAKRGVNAQRLADQAKKLNLNRP